MRVRGIAAAHLLDGLREQPLTMKDMSIFGKETEDQLRHKVVEILAALGLVPVRVFLQQFTVQAVEATGSLDIKAFSRICLTVVIPPSGKKVGIVAGNSSTICEGFGLKAFAVSGENELGFVTSGSRTIAQSCERYCHLTFAAHLEMNITALEHTAG